jgi:integrase
VDHDFDDGCPTLDGIPIYAAIIGDRPIPYQGKQVEETRTLEVIQGLREELQYKGDTDGTFVAYEKQWRRIAEAFQFLPADQGPLLEWLQQFEDPKNRSLWHQALSQLYKHAVKRFGCPSNPLDGIPRPKIVEKPVVSLTLDEARAFDAAPEDDQERLIVDLLLGHGWRGVELRRLTAGNARNAREGEIWIWGKERKEYGPLLTETHDLLLRLSQGLLDDDPVLRARRTQRGIHQPLGGDGLRKWVKQLCINADIKQYKPHDLRRTFGSLVARSSGDSHLVERLLRHGKPSVTDRYINWDLPRLLEQFSPIHQVRTSRLTGGKDTYPPVLTGEESFTRQKLVAFQELGSKVAPVPGGTASS